MQLDKIESQIVSWLNTYLKDSYCKGFVVGISGGVDSALTAFLAAKTGKPLLCIELPIHQSKEQVSRGKEQIESLKSLFPNVENTEVDLSAVYDGMVKGLPGIEDEGLMQLSLANLHARLRMTTLYYFAGIRKSLVVGTGNKVEDFGVGFYTKYGDGGVDLSPIADLTKTEVFALAEHVGVTTSILKAAPTDGLWGDERTDEDQLGATYPELEWAMEQYHKGKTSADFEGREKQVFVIYQSLHKANKHKMVPIPVCSISKEYK